MKRDGRDGRDGRSFDKPPSYYRNNKKDTGFNKADFAEPASEKVPENIVPMKTRERGQKQSSRALKKSPRSKGRRFGGADTIVLTISLILFTLAVGGSLFRYFSRGQQDIAVVGYGSVNLPRVLSGIIVRDETVYTAPVPGELVFAVANGERVSGGTVVSNVESSGNIAPLVAQSDDIAGRIIDLQNMREEISVVSDSVAFINENIRSDLDNRLLTLSTSNRDSFYSLRDSLEQNLTQRNDMLLSENTGALRNLVDEHRQFTQRIAEGRTPIVATGGGIVSHSVDGFEDVLRPGSLADISREQTRMQVSLEPFIPGRAVAAGDNVFKIINSNIWYVAAYIDNDLILDWRSGSAVRLYIEKNGEFVGHPFWVDSVRSGENESFVALRTDRQLQDFLNMRTISFKTYDSIYTGLKIPESSITERSFLKIPESYVEIVRHNVSVVNRQAGSGIEQVTINAKVLRGLHREDGYVYILQDFDNIRRGDTILLDADDEVGYVIDELATAQGVFRTNTGIATFVSINTEGMIRGVEDYVILDPESNRGGIRQHDRIIRDAVTRFIREGDIINQ